MDKADLIAALQVAQAAGCQFVVGVPSLGGSSTVALTPEQAFLLTTDKQALFADVMGLTKPEYIEWHESQGSVYCSARTKQGKQCRNTIVGATWLQPDEWKAQRAVGGYCAAHGA
ncbi:MULTISPECIES: hypothetical protein [Burkholderia]|uniref:hypothetical protein n=1 Tax=Burkholderia sp. Ac-20353 TaxID=2703894 RepID=UPI00071671A5|nr:MULTISPECIES: hypothetical protein [Burkholderia]MBN3785516.1 hypothetical protein [Burkholderia sp. Ac-20353]